MTADTAHQIPELTLGWRLRMAMERSDLDQSRWAEYLGVNRNTITRWTHDKSPVARGHLVAISLRTGVPIEWIETGRGPESTDPDGGQRARRDSNSQPSDLESRFPRRHSPRRVSAAATAA